MKYYLKDCRTAKEELDRKTTVEITENNGEITFVFTAKNCKFYCPYNNYNDFHCDGDICEILIGSDPERKVYYEIEIGAHNKIMLAKMTYNGEVGDKINLGIDFVSEPFVKTTVERDGDNYVATATFPLEKIKTGDGEIFFNAYRIDTNGGKCLNDNQLLFALNPTMRGKFHTPKYYLPLKNYI